MIASINHVKTAQQVAFAAACLSFMLITSHAVPTVAQQEPPMAPATQSTTEATPNLVPIAPAPSPPAAPAVDHTAQDSSLSPPANATPAVEPVAAPGIDRSSLPHDLSPWGMFLAADIVVKIVMVGLAAASFLVWTVWLAKQFQLLFVKRSARRDLIAVANMTSLESARRALRGRRSIATAMISAAEQERAIAAGAIAADGLATRIETRLNDLESRASRSIRSGLSLLATVGATAPFIGLFGTVWGIMNSFIAISKSHTTNLAIVAPGIAEALLATAIGLVAAIPAVILYNQLGISVGGFRAIVRETSSEVLRIVSRERDHRSVTTPFHVIGSAAE